MRRKDGVWRVSYAIGSEGLEWECLRLPGRRGEVALVGEYSPVAASPMSEIEWKDGFEKSAGTTLIYWEEGLDWQYCDGRLHH